MDGIFIRKKPSGYNIFLLLLAAFLIALYFFPQIVDKNATESSISVLIAAILIYSIVIPAMLLNHGAYFRITENRIRAKYHWFGKLDCAIDDVAFVLPQVNTLSILLKNGKRHVIMGIQNPFPCGDVIRRQNFHIETESADTLHVKLQKLIALGKKELAISIVGCVLMFLNIFIAALLTSGRDIPTEADRRILAVMGCVELVTIIGAFLIADRCGKRKLPVEHLRYRLRNAVITSPPWPSNQILHVYTNLKCTGRTVVCGFPEDASVYYCVQPVSKEFTLETIYTSEIFENETVMEEAIGEEILSSMIDITPKS